MRWEEGMLVLIVRISGISVPPPIPASALPGKGEIWDWRGVAKVRRHLPGYRLLPRTLFAVTETLLRESLEMGSPWGSRG